MDLHDPPGTPLSRRHTRLLLAVRDLRRARVSESNGQFFVYNEPKVFHFGCQEALIQGIL
jgi:hypothetical protein